MRSINLRYEVQTCQNFLQNMSKQNKTNHFCTFYYSSVSVSVRVSVTVYVSVSFTYVRSHSHVSWGVVDYAGYVSLLWCQRGFVEDVHGRQYELAVDLVRHSLMEELQERPVATVSIHAPVV